MGCSYSVSFRS